MAITTLAAHGPFVTPAYAGVQDGQWVTGGVWIPASAGMTAARSPQDYASAYF
jgi:hypothetical protein